ncbi:Zn(II)2Cys6 transcription factor domain-containing protein [Aspergillus undulatus]|uniref:Zn(II)2Cys6 transcription factor domain-containing protein n=1 Tax=Aspergillus undulatus TaxID=1810928 RepID=UPI003CCDF588
MSRQPKLRPKSCIAGYSDAMYDFSTMSSLAHLESCMSLGEEKHDQRIFRVKRKHVLKACDRCRVKKTKCDGKQPCNRCSSYNHPCLFRERKATQTKVYSRGFVEMLESHHSLVVKALQRLYKLCTSKEGFPGDPLVETSDGYPLTHAILDRLGLIKHAEDTTQAVGEETESLQYLRVLSSSTDTADPSPEPATPPGPAPILSSPVQLSPGLHEHGPLKWEIQSLHSEPYNVYPHTEYRGMALPRPALEIPSLASESKCTTTAPSPVAGLATPYVYYAEGQGSCNQEAADNRLQPRVTTGLSVLPAVTAAGLPVDLVDHYSMPVHDHQPVYPAPLAAGWAYPCE